MAETPAPFHWTILRVGSLTECLDAWQGSPLYAQLDETFRNASSLVLDELGSNFLRFSGPHAKELKVAISFDGAEMTMTLDDDGEPFNPRTVHAPPQGHVGLLPVGGRGLHMAGKSMDSWTYRLENKRNISVLVKRVKKTQDDEDSPKDNQP